MKKVESSNIQKIFRKLIYCIVSLLIIPNSFSQTKITLLEDKQLTEEGLYYEGKNNASVSNSYVQSIKIYPNPASETINIVGIKK